MRDKQHIVKEAKMNLDRGRAIATGIGVFPVVFNSDGDVLLRRRTERDSLYGDDLSGRWELIGGGADLADFVGCTEQEDSFQRYQGAIFACAAHELEEEAGLQLVRLPHPLVLVPAWLWRAYDRDGEDRISIDTAYAFRLPFDPQYVRETNAFTRKSERGELVFVPQNNLDDIEIVSPRMRFLIDRALEILCLTR
jgi:8-oxo-dGTP pyrophosphatase MutT (NUDIX family)